MNRIAVVHLAWAPLGKGPLEKFFRSYQAHSAGLSHDLVVLMKAHTDADVRNQHAQVFAGVTAQTLDLPDSKFDLDSYRLAAAALTHDFILFLNSYSVILVDDWLAKLYKPFQEKNTGLAGATGSWESPYRDRKLARDYGGRRRLWLLLQARLRFPAFPNPHVRTNAFLIGRQLFLDLRFPKFTAKEDAWRVESGRASITRQIAAQGLRTVVVGADGTVYDPPQWPSARVFRAGNQENLLIADNQTEQYAGATADFRRHLTNLAWGKVT